MQWEVRGAIESTGKEVTLLVDGATEEEAARSPNLKGVLVSSISPVHPPSSSEIVDRVSGGIGRVLVAIAAGIFFIVGFCMSIGGSPAQITAGCAVMCVGLLIFITGQLSKIIAALNDPKAK